MAYLAGVTGKVIGVDQSAAYIQFLNHVADSHGLNIQAIETDFDHMQLENSSLDGMYCRWAMAWISNPKEILAKVLKSLKPGGKMVLHEYYDWSTHQTEPAPKGLSKGISQCLKSFKEQKGDIDIGRFLPDILP